MKMMVEMEAGLGKAREGNNGQKVDEGWPGVGGGGDEQEGRLANN